MEDMVPEASVLAKAASDAVEAKRLREAVDEVTWRPSRKFIWKTEEQLLKAANNGKFCVDIVLPWGDRPHKEQAERYCKFLKRWLEPKGYEVTWEQKGSYGFEPTIHLPGSPTNDL